MVNNDSIFLPYMGNDYYIASFCAKNDFSKMIDILDSLNKKGCNIWYDEENLHNDSLDSSSPYKFLDPKCKKIFLFLSSHSEYSQAVSRLLSYIAKTSPQNVCCVLLENSDMLGNDIINKISALESTVPDKIESIIPAECKKDITDDSSLKNGFNSIQYYDESEAIPQDFIYEKTPDGVKIVKYIGDKTVIVIPSSVEGYEVTEISSFAFAAKLPIIITVPTSVKTVSVSAFSFKNENVTLKCMPGSAVYKFAVAHRIKCNDEKNTDATAYNKFPPETSYKNEHNDRHISHLKLDKDYKEPYIFAGFSAKDLTLVRPLIEKLTVAGYRVYVPEYYENLTEEELEKIEKKIFESRYYMAFITKNYTEDSFCKISLKYALEGNGEYYPVILDDTKDYYKTSEVSGKKKLEIRRADFDDDEAFLSHLVRPLSQCCGNIFMKAQNFKYKIENNKITVKKYIGNDESVVIDSTYLNTPIVEIGEFAFSNCEFIKEISLPNTIKVIGGFAFSGCSRLKNIIIPPSTHTLGCFAFSECRSLKSIIIPDNITVIPDNAFNECSALESVILPKGLLRIGKNAFKGCTSLKDIDIPSSVTLIDDFAFNNCPNIIRQGLPNKFGVTISPDALVNSHKTDFVIDEDNPEQFNYYEDTTPNESIGNRIKNYFLKFRN